MGMAKVVNADRVQVTADFIATELKQLLDRRDIYNHMSNRLKECSTYKDLTNLERELATLQALSAVQAHIVADICDMTSGGSD
jgi:hypothetical protein